MGVCPGIRPGPRTIADARLRDRGSGDQPACSRSVRLGTAVSGLSGLRPRSGRYKAGGFSPGRYSRADPDARRQTFLERGYRRGCGVVRTVAEVPGAGGAIGWHGHSCPGGWFLLLLPGANKTTESGMPVLLHEFTPEAR